MQSLLRDQDKIDHGFEQGHEQGLMEGQLYEKAIDVARNMLETTSLTLEQISEITKLPIIEIEEIKSKIQ